MPSVYEGVRGNESRSEFLFPQGTVSACHARDGVQRKDARRGSVQYEVYLEQWNLMSGH
jgi:hypothetical protein